MSDAWQEIQRVKSKRNELRERLQKRRKEREDLLGGTEAASSSPNLNKIVPTGLLKEDKHKEV
jgi:mRNA m6A methyltransferase catalytic subunit